MVAKQWDAANMNLPTSLMTLVISCQTLYSLPRESTSFIESKLLPVLAEFETGNDCTKIGSKGERSQYQISKEVFDDCGKTDRYRNYMAGQKFRHLSEPSYEWLTFTIARWHTYELILKFCTYHNSTTPPTYEEFYIMWNCGFRGYLKQVKKPSITIKKRAERFGNLARKMIESKN